MSQKPTYEELEQRVRELEIEYARLKQAEKEFRQSESLLRNTFSAIPDLLTIHDRDLRIVLSNWHGHEYITEKERVKQPYCYEVYMHRDTPCEPCHAMEVFATGKPKRLDMTNPVDGITREINVYPIFDEAGEVVMITEHIRDITERKRAVEEKEKLKAQLHQAERMEAIGTLAGGIAHDFNNILAAIIGYTELAKTHMPEESQAEANLDEVLKAGNRAKDLVKQMLTFSRQRKAEPRPLEINSVIKETIKLLRASIPTTIEIRKNIAKEASKVMADPTQIHQVLMNLCTNAAFAMSKEGGILGIGLENIDLKTDKPKYPDLRPGPYIRLTVSDTGTGMDEAVKARIFDPFFTTKGPGEGTGLGLSVVHGIVKSHGGIITVYSEPGKGATFHVLLPGIEGKIAPDAEKAEPLPTGTERILLVDDEEALVKMTDEMLKRLGYEVVSRTSSVEALEVFRIQSDKFDLVITDLTMPNMTGEQLARELINIKRDIPIILCTGYSQTMSDEQAKSVGIYGFVMKPMVMRELAETIRRVLDVEERKDG